MNTKRYILGSFALGLALFATVGDVNARTADVQVIVFSAAEVPVIYGRVNPVASQRTLTDKAGLAGGL